MSLGIDREFFSENIMEGQHSKKKLWRWIPLIQRNISSEPVILFF